MKTLFVLPILAFCSFAGSLERAAVLQEAKANARRLAEYQKLSAKAFSASKAREALMAEWIAVCSKERGIPREDGGCQEKPVTPAQAQPQAQRQVPRPPATPPPSTEVPK